ncbi:MAG TPA: M28 family metallopeptidase [Bryobacteraceae bacterium]|nr:M28 family metallopeptidase [Bryobacteraceae bacterium]
MKIQSHLFMFASAGVLLAATVDFNAEGQRWWSHIQYLASDEMQGRNTGSPEHLKAARYVAGEYERFGLKPAGTSGYIQPVPFDVQQIVEEQSNLALVRNGKAEPLVLGDDATFSLRGDIQPDTEAGAVFVGYGLRVPEKHYDDLAGLDLKGKMVVLVSGGPSSIPGPLKAHYSSGGERWKYLKAAGAVGIATIQNPKSMDIPWSRARLSRFMPSMSLADPSLDESQGLRLAVTINAERADKWFQGTGHTIAEILADADSDRPLPHFALPVSVRAHVQLKKWKVESQNVAAVLPGSDAKLKNEYVVLTAHLDHVGVGEPINGDKIYNGAMDDASGVASDLEIARMLHESNAKPRRSILFLAVTGEEKGLQGSRYFAAHPTVSGKNIVADINMDMFLPLHALHYLEVQGLDESTLGDDIRAVAQAAGVQVQADKEPQRNLFIRSDQYSFIRHGIPALAFKFGYLPGSPEEKLHKDWLRDRYHAPSDDLNQPVDKVAAAQFDRIILALAERVADAPSRPEWKPDSFFRRFAGGNGL